MRQPLSIFQRPVLLVAALLLTLGLSACAQETAGPEAGADVGELQNDFAALEEDVAGLEDRIGDLEEAEAADDTFDDGALGDEAVDDEPLVEPESFVGEQVTVSAEVERIITTRAFTLSGPQGELLVVRATAAGDNEIVEEDAVVQVTGTVREAFSITEAEEEFGVDFDDALFTEFEEQHYIVATSVSEAPTENE